MSTCLHSNSLPLPSPFASPRHSILLNQPPTPSTRSKSLSIPPPIHTAHSNNSLSSTSSSSSTDATSLSSQSQSGHLIHPRSNSTPSSRRIRFAPLPDPRRSVVVTEKGEEFPLPQTDDEIIDCATIVSSFPDPDGQTCGPSSQTTDSGSIEPYATDKPASRPESLEAPLEHPMPLLGEGVKPPATPLNRARSPIDPNATITTTPLSSSPPSSPTPTKSEPSGLSWSRPKSFLQPFLKRGSSPAPGGIGVGKEELLTLGTFKLFRNASKDSLSKDSNAAHRRAQSEHEADSSALSRWTTGGSGKPRGKEWLGSPLSRTESTQSYKGDDRKIKRPATSPGTKASTGRKGTRMLNGRVYGARRGAAPNANPFANARDEEPQFVEWGYGGMGSVKNGTGAGWGRLQSGGNMMVGSVEDKSHGQSAGGEAEDDLDDGSGMGWVKKRREQREREKREREQKEAEEKEAAKKIAEESELTEGLAVESPVTIIQSEDDENSDSPTPPLTPTATSPQTSPVISVPVSTPSSPSANYENDLSIRQELAGKEPEKHTILTAIPPLHRSHSHHRSHSGSNLPGNLSLNTAVTTLNEANAGAFITTSPTSITGIPIAEQESDSDDEDDPSESSSSEDDDEDDDEENDVRKTSLCAGVEKISRHKDKDEH